MDFQHVPVLLDEVIEGLNIKENGIYVDGTLGGAGHSLEIIKRLKKGQLIGIDQDINAINKSTEVLKDHLDKATLVQSNYANIENVLKDLGVEKVDGILLDIGVSSHQLDVGERGFSYHQDAPLDMRMNRDQELSAWDVVNKYSKEDLQKIIWEYGEEKWSKRIAEFIVREREEASIDTTFQLVDIIKKAIPKKFRMDSHPAQKTFQAIRIEVNDELNVLGEAIPKMVRLLNKGGRICIITFHSLEDRIVKRSFNQLARECICPSDFPVCVCDKEKELEVITRKPIVPKDIEVKRNPRSRSAKLRIGARI